MDVSYSDAISTRVILLKKHGRQVIPAAHAIPRARWLARGVGSHALLGGYAMPLEYANSTSYGPPERLSLVPSLPTKHPRNTTPS